MSGFHMIPFEHTAVLTRSQARTALEEAAKKGHVLVTGFGADRFDRCLVRFQQPFGMFHPQALYVLNQ